MATPNGSSRNLVENYMRRKLASLAPGDRMPAIRQIKEACGVSQSVVDRVLIQLQQEGLLEVRKPAGIFKAEPVKSKIVILCFKPLWRDETSFYTYFMNTMNYHLINDNRKIEIVCGKDAVVSALESSERMIYLTFGMKWQEYSLLCNCPKPILHVLPDFIDNLPNMVSVDDEELIRSQIEYLTVKGFRRIGYLHNYIPGKFARPRNCRWEAFHRFGLEFHLDMRPEYFYHVANDPTMLKQGVKTMLELHEPPEAFILPNDGLARYAYEAIFESGLTPGKEIAVMGTNNRVWGNFLIPPLTSAGFDLDAGFIHMLEIITGMEQDKSPEPVIFPVKISPRASA